MSGVSHFLGLYPLQSGKTVTATEKYQVPAYVGLNVELPKYDMALQQGNLQSPFLTL